jgi:cell division protein FtsB
MNDLKESQETMKQANDELKQQQNDLKNIIDTLNREKTDWVDGRIFLDLFIVFFNLFFRPRNPMSKV